MAKKKGKSIFGFGMHTLINWGATVVIIGLMFKILHFEGGEMMIGIGLAAEAFLFFVMGFMKVPEDPHWEKVYPELDDDYQGSPTAAVAQPVVGRNTEALDKLLQNAKIDEHLIGSLGDGLRIFSNKVASISRVSDTVLATDSFADKLNAASTGVDRLGRAFDRTADDLAAFNDSTADVRQFKDQVKTFNKTLTSLNAIYGNMLSAMNPHRV